VDLDRMPPPLLRTLTGDLFRRRRRLAVVFSTPDPDGCPRVALLTLGEVRAVSPSQLAVAVLAGSRTAANLIRRRRGTLIVLQRGMAAYVQSRAGRGRVSVASPERQIFPMTVQHVRMDSPTRDEQDVALLSGPTFGGRGAAELFSEELFEELGLRFPH
jgi:multidrug efflux pump subunit AcrA (membrane-fusion protein)